MTETAGVAEELDEPDWPGPLHKEAADPPTREWLFWGFLICMAIAALPLVVSDGLRRNGREPLLPSRVPCCWRSPSSPCFRFFS